jgi:multiple sugar transport system substrate-binding protein
MEYVPGGDYTRKLTAWMAGGATPEVMLLQDEPFPRYLANSSGENPVLLDLTPLIRGETFGPELTVRAEDYWPTAWESFGRQERGQWRQYGLPLFGGNNLIFYNRECFRRAGVPLPEESGIDRDWTTGDFLELCRRLTLREEKAGAARTVQWGFDRPFGWLYWLPFIYACDADILSGDRTEYVFTGPAALESLKLWDDLRRDGLVPAGGDLGQMGQNVAFLTGRVAMVCQGPWIMPFMNAAKTDYGVMFPPVSPTHRRGTRVTWDCVALAGRLRNDPPRMRMAYEFARFVVSPAAAEIVSQVQRSVPACKAGQAAFVAGSDATRAARFVAGLEFSRIQPITLKWEEMDEALRNGLGPLTRGAATPEQAVQDMAGRILKKRLFPVRWNDGGTSTREAPNERH